MVRYRRSTGPIFWELKACSGEWHSTLPHCHAEWSAGFVETGSCQVGCGGQTVQVQAPALVWFAPETVHECRPSRTEDWAFHMVYWRAPGPQGHWGTQRLVAAEVGEWRDFFVALAMEQGPTPPEWLVSRGFGVPGPAPLAPTPRIPHGVRPDRAYKRLHGLAPSRHQTILKLRRAQELLRRGATPAHAALEAGFYDQSQFTRAFRSLTGTTPGRFVRPAP